MMSNVYDMESTFYARVLYALWYLCIIILGLVGNFIIIIASVRFKGIRLDKISVMLIRHIAVADVMHIILVVIPAETSIICNRWVFGDTFCKIQTYLLPIFFSTSMFLLCGLNINKLVCLMDPLRSKNRSSRTGRYIGASFWLQVIISMTIVHLSTFSFKKWDYHYSSTVFHCSGTYLDAGSFYEILTAVSLLVPSVVIIITTACLLCFVHQINGLQKQSVQTLVLVSTVFCISFIPFGITTALVASGNPLKSFGINLAVYLRITTMLGNLNVGVNAIIYFMTINSFNKFVKNLRIHLKQMFVSKNKMQVVPALTKCKSTGTVLSLVD